MYVRCIQWPNAWQHAGVFNPMEAKLYLLLITDESFRCKISLSISCVTYLVFLTLTKLERVL